MNLGLGPLLAALLLGATPAPVPASSPPSPPAAAVTTLDDLLGGLARLPGFEASFREEKTLALLEAPLVSQGTLHFAPPSLLARHMTSPSRGSLVIDGTTMRFGQAGKPAGSVDLARSPVARLFAESFVLVLRGDRPALERIYKLEWRPATAGRWQLTLTPKPPEMARLIAHIVLRGAGLGIRELDIEETGGDRSHTTFGAVNLERRYSADERVRIFRVP